MYFAVIYGRCGQMNLLGPSVQTYFFRVFSCLQKVFDFGHFYSGYDHDFLSWGQVCQVRGSTLQWNRENQMKPTFWFFTQPYDTVCTKTLTLNLCYISQLKATDATQRHSGNSSHHPYFQNSNQPKFEFFTPTDQGEGSYYESHIQCYFWKKSS